MSNETMISQLKEATDLIEGLLLPDSYEDIEARAIATSRIESVIKELEELP